MMCIAGVTVYHPKSATQSCHAEASRSLAAAPGKRHAPGKYLAFFGIVQEMAIHAALKPPHALAKKRGARSVSLRKG
jgi:hypothetical protein